MPDFPKSDGGNSAPGSRERSGHPPVPGATLEVTIDDLGGEGEGVGRADGFVVFVPGTVPGDRVLARVEHVRRSFARGTLVRILAPSPARREPPCPHQPACGGCPLMVLPEEEALARKVRHLEETLRRIGRVALAAGEVVPSSRPLRYRGRVRLAVGPPGIPEIGYRPPGDPRGLVPVTDCLLAPEGAVPLARRFVLELARGGGIGPRDWPREIEVRASFAEDRFLLVVHGPRAAGRRLRGVAEGLLLEEERLAGVVLVPGGRGRHEPVPLGGETRLAEEIAGLRVPLGPTSFLQVNPAAAEHLYRLVRERLALPDDPRAPLLDLYCGAGLGGLLGTPEGTPVTGVERSAEAVTAARALAARAGREGCRFLDAPVEGAVEGFAAEGVRFPRALVNPPRAGAGREVLHGVASLGPRRVVLVSCHPATLARDAAILREFGYVPRGLAAVDMFPQTAHLEAVLRFDREEADA